MKIENHKKNIIMPTILPKKNEKNSIKNIIKKNYTSYSKLSEVKLITIGLASPERIKQWSEKMLPNGKILGEVMNANTLHHKTFKPQKGGLFCERIFGPLKDFECACGKPMKSLTKKNENLIKQKQEISNLNNSNEKNINFETNTLYQKSKKIINLNKSILGASEVNSILPQGQIDLDSSKSNNQLKTFCNICEVEYTWSVMRRYQLGYIKLISPVTHVWYLKGNPSYLSILLDIKKRHLEYINYCSETLTLENVLKGGTLTSKSSDIVSSWKKLKLKIKSEQKNSFNETKLFKENSKFNTNSDPDRIKQSLFLKTNFKSKFISYTKICESLNKNNKTFNEQINSTNYLSNILENERNKLKEVDYSYKNHFLTKYLSISNLNTNKTNVLSKLTYTLTNVQKLKKRNDLKFKKFDFTKNFLNRNKEIDLSNSIVSLPSSKSPASSCSLVDMKTIQSRFFGVKKNPIFDIKMNNMDAAYMVSSKHPDAFLNDLKFLKCLKNYSQKLFSSFKNLKYLNTLILQSKNSFKICNENNKNTNFPLNNNSDKFKYKNFRVENTFFESNSKKLKIFPIKKILKKISVSAYILVKINVFSQKTINKNLINLAWEKVSHEAYIKALVRSNQILNRVNFGYYDRNLCFNTNEKDFLNRPSYIIKDNAGRSSINLEFLFKKIKKRVYNLLKITQEKISNSKINNFSNKSELLPAGSFQAAFRKNKLELFTLSSFPGSFAIELISTFLLNDINIISNLLTEKKKSTNYLMTSIVKNEFKSIIKIKQILKIITQDLTSIFIKTILKNKNFKLNFWFKYQKSNFNFNKSSYLTIFTTPYLKSDFLKLNQFNEIKTDLINHFLFTNLEFVYKKLIYSFFQKNKNVKKIVEIEKRITEKNMPKSNLIKYKNNLDIKFFKNYLKLNKVKLFKNKLEANFVVNKSYSKNVKLKDYYEQSALLAGPAMEAKDIGSKPVKSAYIVGSDHTATTIKTKKLFNNIYCLSHRERWEVENDWNFLYYYVTVQKSNTSDDNKNPYLVGATMTDPAISSMRTDSMRLPLTSLNGALSENRKSSFNIFEGNESSNQTYLITSHEKIIYNYRNRFENIYKTDFLNCLKDSNIGENSQNSLGGILTNRLFLNSSTLFSGPGIVQLLLSEFNFFEIKKIDKQNRILLYQLNKQIIKLKKKNL